MYPRFERNASLESMGQVLIFVERILNNDARRKHRYERYDLSDSFNHLLVLSVSQVCYILGKHD